jgi:hypothetical protein
VTRYDRDGGGRRRALAVAAASLAVVLAATLLPAGALAPGGDAVEAGVGTPVPGPDVDTGSDDRSGVAGDRGDGTAPAPSTRAQLRRLHANGVTGAGVDVGVVDVTGFDVDDPAIDGQVRAARSFAPDGGVADGGRSRHGTAVAATVAATAPDARLTLATFDRPAGFARAVAWLVDRDVDVIVAPVAVYGAAGDGTSTTARAAARAARAGVVVVAPTGNLAGGHWGGRSRPGPDGRLRFGPRDGPTRLWLSPPARAGDRTRGRLTAWLSVPRRQGSDDSLVAGADAPAGSSLELVVYRANASGSRVVATSTPAPEVGPGIERLRADLRPGQHYLAVRGGAGARPETRLTVASPTHDLSPARPAGSVVAPATARAGGVLAVGATGPGGVAGYSSRGPTADGRLGVDVVGSTARWPAVGADAGAGTSAAAASVGGTVALVRGATPGLAPAEVELVVRSTARDVGRVGPDVAAGHGRVQPRPAVRRARAVAAPGAPDASNRSMAGAIG